VVVIKYCGVIIVIQSYFQVICSLENDVLSLDDITLDEECERSTELSEECSDKADGSCPRVGMCFESPNEVMTFYRQYGIRKGFGMRTRSSKKGTDNELRYFILVCSRQGNYVSAIPAYMQTQPTQEFNCPARIIVTKKEDKWYITSFGKEHSHDLSPTKSRMFRSNKKINLKVKRKIEMNDDAGVRLNKSFASLVHQARGYDNLPFGERDIRNYVSEQRRILGKEGDGKALLNHFSRMCQLNKDFFFEIDMDQDNRIRNVFWADARSRAVCHDFGDAVSFDTTYLTNKYDMPFAPFMGVNHHGQSIFLGCGLLSSENTTTFVWLFQCWLRCMSNKAPHGIVTNQCQAMKNVISIVFPNTCHRWCLWHIMKKIPEKLSGYTEYNAIKKSMKVVLYKSKHVEEFESEWANFISTFELSGNEWLGSLYADRE